MTTDPNEPNPPPARPSRRTLIVGAAATAGIATVAGLWFEGFGDPARRRRIEPTPEGAPLRSLEPGERKTLAAALDRLLPSGGPRSPGARDVNAAGYLDALFADDELSEYSQKLILWGTLELDRRAAATHPGKAFAALGPDGQDAILRTMETTTDGVRWLRTTLEFVLECFFGDPVHGGNTNEIGWKWIRHRPGTPRPTQPGWTLREVEDAE